MSYRKRFPFWFDLHKPDELELAQYVVEQKSTRMYSATIRDAIRLIRDLRQRKFDVLFQLFPWIREWMDAEIRASVAVEVTARFEEKIDRLLKVTEVSPLPSRALLGFPKDDPALEISAAQADPHNNNPAYNFLISTTALIGDYSKLPDEVIEYGIRTGKLPASLARPKSLPAEIPEPPIDTEQDTIAYQPIAPALELGNARHLAVSQLAAPVFDDDELAFS